MAADSGAAMWQRTPALSCVVDSGWAGVVSGAAGAGRGRGKDPSAGTLDRLALSMVGSISVRSRSSQGLGSLACSSHRLLDKAYVALMLSHSVIKLILCVIGPIRCRP